MKIRMLLCFWVGFSIVSVSGQSNHPWARVKLVQANKVRLKLSYHPNGATTLLVKQEYPKAIAVLTGNYFHPLNRKALAGFAKSGNAVIARPSGRQNRPVLVQYHRGCVDILTISGAWACKDAISFAVEGGPFLVANGKDWHEFDFKDKQFYRFTARRAVGLTKSGKFFWAYGQGTLSQFRARMKKSLSRRGESVKVAMNIDGGSSAASGARLPTRIAVLSESAPVK